MDTHEGDGDRRQAPQPAPTIGVDEAASHAGIVAVLGSRMLWDHITGFMTGYPFSVHKFYQESDPTTLYSRQCALTCSSSGMDDAAGNGHLNVVEFLHYNRTEGCTQHAIRLAAMNGHHSVAGFLSEHRSEGNVVHYLTGAVEYDHLGIVKLLHSSESAYPAVEAAIRCLNADMIRFLCENQAPGSMSILKQAVTNGAECVSCLLCCNIQLWRMMIDAKEYALKQNMPEIVEVTADHIQLNVPPNTL